jgi:hypothetical protein
VAAPYWSKTVRPDQPYEPLDLILWSTAKGKKKRIKEKEKKGEELTLPAGGDGAAAAQTVSARRLWWSLASTKATTRGGAPS